MRHDDTERIDMRMLLCRDDLRSCKAGKRQKLGAPFHLGWPSFVPVSESQVGQVQPLQSGEKVKCVVLLELEVLPLAEGHPLEVAGLAVAFALAAFPKAEARREAEDRLLAVASKRVLKVYSVSHAKARWRSDDRAADVYSTIPLPKSSPLRDPCCRY